MSHQAEKKDVVVIQGSFIPKSQQPKTLLYAAKTGDVDLCAKLLHQGANPMLLNHQGWTPIHVAASKGYTTICRLLIEATCGGAVDHQTPGGITPLLAAAKAGHADTCRFLLDQGADPNHLGKKGKESPLITAIEASALEVVHALVAKGADVNLIPPGLSFSKITTPVHAAAERGLTSICRLLVEAGADLGFHQGDIGDLRCFCGEPPLHRAVRNGHLDTVNYFLSAGADPNAEGHHQITPLLVAASHGRYDIARALLSAGAKIDPRTDSIKSGAVSDQISEGGTALHRAAQHGDVEMCRLLIEAGADPDVRQNLPDDHTPLHVAASEGRSSACVFLLSQGADINILSSDGHSPLHEALKFNRKETTKILVDAGADLNIQGTSGRTPLQVAVSRADTEVVRLVVEAGASLSHVDRNGDSLLHFAARSGKKKTCEYLMNLGLDPMAVNHDDLTPIDIVPDYLPNLKAFMESYALSRSAAGRAAEEPSEYGGLSL